jgi:hypothetical protein
VLRGEQAADDRRTHGAETEEGDRQLLPWLVPALDHLVAILGKRLL